MRDPIKKSANYFEPGVIPLRIMRVALAHTVAAHQHEFSELVLITGGHGIHFTDTEEHPILAGDVFVINGSTTHGYGNSQGLTLFNILFDGPALRIPEWDIRQLPGYHALFTLEPHYRARHKFSSRLRLPIDDLLHASALTERMEHEFAAREPGFQHLALAHFMTLTTFLARCYGRARTPSTRPLMRLAHVISHLEQHFTEAITIQQLASMAHMSESSLRRAFQETTGHAPIDYLIRLRIARAVKLLGDTTLRISEIAWRTGFEDSNYFARQFRHVTGHTPRAYRRNRKGQSTA